MGTRERGCGTGREGPKFLPGGAGLGQEPGTTTWAGGGRAMPSVVPKVWPRTHRILT